MDPKKLQKILLTILLALAGVIYLYTVAPTLSFWDCGEFIASAFTMAVPHPPGTPLYVFLGRVWMLFIGLFAAVLPISKEVAWHMNLLGITFSLLTVFLIFKLMLKVFQLWHKNGNQHVCLIIAFATALAISFFNTYWNNAVETEVYAASTFIFILITYLALLWYESVKEGAAKNKFLLMVFYLIFLSTGIHLIPFLIFIPLYVFIYVVERRYLKDILLLLLGIFQLLYFPLLFLVPENLYMPLFIFLAIILLAGIGLPLSNPLKYRNYAFFWIGVLLVILGSSSEIYLPIRSRKLTELYKDPRSHEQYLQGKNIAPRINECDPGENLAAFDNVLHRAQYGPQKIIPRQTQDDTGFNLIQGYAEQMFLFIRYLSWQVAPEDINHLLRAVLLTLFYALCIWGAVELFKREKKVFILMMLILFMLSFAIVGYLNLKFSPSDANPKHQPREVRERDYFFHTSHVYFGILMGLGLFGMIEWLDKETKKNKLAQVGALGGTVVFAIMPLFTNLHVDSRYKNFIPRDYGYNMLVSCDDDAVIFTNGDNDTFPLWFVQEVLGFKRSVIVANLSLINTDWYIQQLREWGAPVKFSDYVIKRLQPFMTQDRRVIYVKDIMIRHIIAVNAGIELKDADYFSSQTDFAAKYLKGYSGKRPIYFASTVSADNYQGFAPYLKLEGLVYRLVGDSIPFPYNVDIKRTEEFFYTAYRYTGVFEPKKQQALRAILNDFDRRKKEQEFLDYTIVKDENTQRLYSNYAAGLFYLGLVLKERADIQGTLNAWRFGLMFEPEGSHTFYFNMGLLYAQLGVADSADSYFSRIDVKDPQILTQIGGVYRMVGKLDKALEYFNKVIEINPRMPQGYMGLLSVYLDSAMHDTNSAKNVLKDWIRMNPGDTTAIAMLRELGG
jgi:tetratricopeptide (TPR) repeat protein